MSGSQGPSIFYRLFTRLVLIVGFVAALWLGIHMAAQHPPGGGSRDVSTGTPWHSSDPTAEARGTVVHR